MHLQSENRLSLMLILSQSKATNTAACPGLGQHARSLCLPTLHGQRPPPAGGAQPWAPRPREPRCATTTAPGTLLHCLAALQTQRQMFSRPVVPDRAPDNCTAGWLACGTGGQRGDTSDTQSQLPEPKHTQVRGLSKQALCGFVCGGG